MYRLFIPIFLLAIHWLTAQTPAYLHYDVSDGLPSALVYCARQDSRGLLWFGTDKGLARFDGTDFKVFNMKDGLPDPEVIDIFEDSQQRLWLSCFHKKPCYRSGSRFITAKNSPDLGRIDMTSGIFKFYEAAEGAIWISGDYHKFCRWMPDSLQCYDSPVRTDSKNTTLNTHFTISAVNGFDDDLYAFGISWIGKILPSGLEPVYYKSESFEDLTYSSPTVAFNGRYILFSYLSAIVLIEYADGQFREVDRMKMTQNGSVFSDPGGLFWMSIPQEGVLKIGLKNGRLQKQGLFMKGKKVSKVFQDREGTIWFSTLNDGVYALPKNAVLTYSKIHDPFFKSDNFTALNILPDGTLAAGDDSGNLYFRKDGAWTLQKVGSNDGYNRVRQILPLPGNDWMAVTDELVFSKERGAFKVLVNGVRNQGASKFAYHGEGVTWLANSYNLLNWGKDPDHATILKNSRSSAVGADAEGNVWAGGLNGLFSQKDTFQMSWGDRFKQLGSRIIAIERAGNNSLWVATPDYGLLRVYVSKGEVTAVEEVNSILKKPIENIQSIFTEPGGKVWLSTNKGVFALSDDYEVSHFDQKNGLANNDVNAVVVSGDTLWAATVAGLSQMLLRQPDERVNFPTLFTALRYEIGDQKVVVDLLDTLADSKKITLPPGTSLLELSVTALQYRGGGGFQFEFMTTEELLPFSRLTFGNIVRAVSPKFGKHCEKDFVEGSTWNYGTHVSPGRYHLTATAVLQGGVLSNQPDEWTITVLPSWWETIWFILLVLGLVAYVIWRLVRAALAYRKLEAAASQLQLQAIKAQINPHFIGNSINAIQQFFYPPDPVKASKYISIFSDLLRRTMFFSEKNFIPFIDEVGYVKDYLEMIQLRFGDGFSFQINGADKVPPETPFPTMVLQPVLENATIHGRSPVGESFLKVEFLYENGRLTCLITDNGVGINTSLEKKRAGDSNRHSKGLSLLKEKVQMLNSLYALDLRLSLKEITENEAEQGGTQAEISFNPPKQSEIPQRN